MAFLVIFVLMDFPQRVDAQSFSASRTMDLNCQQGLMDFATMRCRKATFTEDDPIVSRTSDQTAEYFFDLKSLNVGGYCGLEGLESWKSNGRRTSHV